jgi:hypothetical protein
MLAEILRAFGDRTIQVEAITGPGFVVAIAFSGPATRVSGDGRPFGLEFSCCEAPCGLQPHDGVDTFDGCMGSADVQAWGGDRPGGCHCGLGRLEVEVPVKARHNEPAVTRRSGGGASIPVAARSRSWLERDESRTLPPRGRRAGALLVFDPGEGKRSTVESPRRVMSFLSASAGLWMSADHMPRFSAGTCKRPALVHREKVESPSPVGPTSGKSTTALQTPDDRPRNLQHLRNAYCWSVEVRAEGLRVDVTRSQRESTRWRMSCPQGEDQLRRVAVRH